MNDILLCSIELGHINIQCIQIKENGFENVSSYNNVNMTELACGIVLDAKKRNK